MKLLSKFFSQALLSTDILDRKHFFDKELKCNFKLTGCQPNETFLGANAFICVGKVHNFKIYGETKISESFSVDSDKVFVFDFDLFVPFDQFLTGKEIFLLVEVYKNSLFKKRAVAILKLNEK